MKIRASQGKFVGRKRIYHVRISLTQREQGWLLSVFSQMVMDKETVLWQDSASRELVNHACMVIYPQVKRHINPVLLTAKSVIFLDMVLREMITLIHQQPGATHQTMLFFRHLRRKLQIAVQRA